MAYTVSMSQSGRINLPAPLRKKLGLTGGGALLVDETENGLVLRTVAQSIIHAQTLAQKYTGKEASVDDFLANRLKDSGE
ncbi:MAG: AbrB family transcriptional regulator [Alphaproteobacteria bacterium]|nr:AbrB family transcriptional regulator [Alphaproteobacteria bacterium]